VKKAKTPQISRIFTDLAKADLKIKALLAAMPAFSVLHFSCCMDWLFKIREIRVIRGVFGILVTRTFNCTRLYSGGVEDFVQVDAHAIPTNSSS
jgi:hypothetical protein